MKRVVITGQGTINAIGHNVKETLASFAAGTVGISQCSFQDIERLNIKIGAEIKEYSPNDIFSRQEISLYDPFTQFAVIAAKEAVLQSGLCFSDELAQNSGVVLGTAGGGLQTQDENYRMVFQAKKNRVHPFTVPRLMNSSAVSHVSMIHNLQGPSFTVSSACASSNHAMGQAFQMIRSGEAQVMLTGGSESMLCFGGIKAWEGLRVLSNTGCRPFCATRDGLVQGEGAAVFVFEEYEHACKRGANILAELAGFAMSSDASNIVMPSVNGAVRAIDKALRNASLSPSQIGYINAHGTGTKASDQSETQAIKQVFKEDAKGVMVSSTKSMHGHLMGGAGAVEILACIAALNDGLIAPTMGFCASDSSCDLDIVPNEARHYKVTATLSNAFAFGGLNAVIALKAI